MGASCSTDGTSVKSRGHGSPKHLSRNPPTKTAKLDLNRKRLKNPDGTINRPWKVEGGKVRWQGLNEEALDLTNDEMDLVVLPAIELLQHDRILKLCSEDLLIRCTRGYTNNVPESKRFQACVPNVGNHVAALAEALDRIVSCRNHNKVMANELLNRKIPLNNLFHKCWPQSISGKDVHGHYIMCERLSDIDFPTVSGSFTVEDFLLHTSQRAEAVQLMQTKESMRRLAAGESRAYKHVHIIDLSGLSMYQFMRLKSTLVPVFKHCADQYPNTMWKIFAVNSPALFSGIWNVLKAVIDPETAAKVNILSIADTVSSEQRFREAGMERDQLPSWLFEGACGKQIACVDLLEQSMEENVFESDSPLKHFYYPPINKTLADRLVAGCSLPVAEVKVVPEKRSRSRSRKRTSTASSSPSNVPSLSSSTDAGANPNAKPWFTVTQSSIVLLLLVVVALLVFIAWHQVATSAASAAPTTCTCSCPSLDATAI